MWLTESLDSFLPWPMPWSWRLHLSFATHLHEFEQSLALALGSMKILELLRLWSWYQTIHYDLDSRLNNKWKTVKIFKIKLTYGDVSLWLITGRSMWADWHIVWVIIIWLLGVTYSILVRSRQFDIRIIDDWLITAWFIFTYIWNILNKGLRLWIIHKTQFKWITYQRVDWWSWWISDWTVRCDDLHLDSIIVISFWCCLVSWWIISHQIPFFSSCISASESCSNRIDKCCDGNFQLHSNFFPWDEEP